eukprot:TRINITY_DN710_c0_g1_i3.p1 TRINITY_DN710_c0_g1~~TRINITY_DN710_c0_g1_i3.p1  ORF type:complete len:498 (+),score=179.92 TRINITY_DN710_c0_g1_i3:95-1588(+)
MSILEKIHALRDFNGNKRQTVGLSDDEITALAAQDERIAQVVDAAVAAQKVLIDAGVEDLLKLDEKEQMTGAQEGIVNFYPQDSVQPYVALAGLGPWVVSTCGAVLFDTGGYGMLCFGHNPKPILAALAGDQVMANVMTPSMKQRLLINGLRKEIGHTRGDSPKPFDSFIFMNSGSESVTVAARICDVRAKTLVIDEGGKHFGKTVKHASLAGGFHGRTDRPAQFSDSCRKKYNATLASFQDLDDFLTVRPNDVEHVKEVYAQAIKDNVFIEAFFMEPVMGEGNPGEVMTPEFYKTVRELTKANDTLLLVDSIQAGLRGAGVLSVVDYPGYQGIEGPDMETYSKALNAGQYPMSILAMNSLAAETYERGTYGNTMTAAPRAMDVAVAVLKMVTPAVRANIISAGEEAVTKLKALQAELPELITDVQGSGLLFSCELAEQFKVVGYGSVEEYMRMNGILVIHGGKSSLRFTPTFDFSSTQIDLLIKHIKTAVLKFKKD